MDFASAKKKKNRQPKKVNKNNKFKNQKKINKI